MDKRRHRFEKIYKQLSNKEKDKCLILSLSGMYDRSTNTILMGSDAMDRYLQFQDEMIKKYERKSNPPNKLNNWIKDYFNKTPQSIG
jgi:hypothetical protein